MTIKAVLLDVDGTLIDSNDAHAWAWQIALRQHGLEVAFERLRLLIGKGGDKLLAEVAGIDEKSAKGEQIGRVRREVFTERYLPKLIPTAGARDLLLRFIVDGLQLVVATSAGGEELQALLDQAGVADLMDEAATSSDAQASKPDPDIIEVALRKSGLRPEEVVMLGDTPYNISSAAAAGVECIALRCGGGWTDSFFTGALAIYDSPAHLLRCIKNSPLKQQV